MSENKPAHKKKASLSLAGVRVLYVDANFDICELVRVLLENRGAKVVAANSVAEGFDTLKKLKPDVLVAEILLPDEDGYSLIHKVRELLPEAGGQTPALALTTCAYLHDRESTLSAGYQEYMTKPFDLDALVNTVAELAGRSGKG